MQANNSIADVDEQVSEYSIYYRISVNSEGRKNVNLLIEVENIQKQNGAK